MGAQASFVMTSAQASNPVLGYRFVFHNNFLAMAHGYVVYQGGRQGGLRVPAPLIKFGLEWAKMSIFRPNWQIWIKLGTNGLVEIKIVEIR